MQRPCRTWPWLQFCGNLRCFLWSSAYRFCVGLLGMSCTFTIEQLQWEWGHHSDNTNKKHVCGSYIICLGNSVQSALHTNDKHSCAKLWIISERPAAFFITTSQLNLHKLPKCSLVKQEASIGWMAGLAWQITCCAMCRAYCWHASWASSRARSRMYCLFLWNSQHSPGAAFNDNHGS